MKKVAIIRCLDVSMRCVGASCMKSFNNRTVKFERYGDEELELFASLTCNGCGQTVENDEGLKKKLDRLAEEPVDVVHFSSCTNKKDKSGEQGRGSGVRHTPLIFKTYRYRLEKERCCVAVFYNFF